MPSYGFVRRGVGELTGAGGVGLTAGEMVGLGLSEVDGCGDIGLPIAINSETVTNLNPFASS